MSAGVGLISLLTCECCSAGCDCGCVMDCPAPACRRVRDISIGVDFARRMAAAKMSPRD